MCVDSKIRLIPESVNYVMSPARFPVLATYKNHFLIVTGGAITILFSTVGFVIGEIDRTLFISLLTISITAMLTLINIVSKRL